MDILSYAGMMIISDGSLWVAGNQSWVERSPPFHLGSTTSINGQSQRRQHLHFMSQALMTSMTGSGGFTPGTPVSTHKKEYR